ncbi:hypothetical protein PR048_018406 [Dryococelus australis]|uniref:Uncharacterized protein n=1 Tax=Dryococelus australis TaxID=614101 RepID=A0ABQ9HCF1_9NEOP|nr:hypothetical protein PR048_018406 [Dryococelus australis]
MTSGQYLMADILNRFSKPLLILQSDDIDMLRALTILRQLYSSLASMIEDHLSDALSELLKSKVEMEEDGGLAYQGISLSHGSSTDTFKDNLGASTAMQMHFLGGHVDHSVIIVNDRKKSGESLNAYRTRIQGSVSYNELPTWSDECIRKHQLNDPTLEPLLECEDLAVGQNGKRDPFHCGEDVEKWCRMCDTCTARKRLRDKVSSRYTMLEAHSRGWRMVVACCIVEVSGSGSGTPTNRLSWRKIGSYLFAVAGCGDGTSPLMAGGCLLAGKPQNPWGDVSPPRKSLISPAADHSLVVAGAVEGGAVTGKQLNSRGKVPPLHMLLISSAADLCVVVVGANASFVMVQPLPPSLNSEFAAWQASPFGHAWPAPYNSAGDFPVASLVRLHKQKAISGVLHPCCVVLFYFKA